MTAEAITELALEHLVESPFNPRRIFAGLEELAANIKAEGRVHEPLLVRPRIFAQGVARRSDGQQEDGDTIDGYELVFGHRRLRAAALAGLTTVPCMVRAMTDAEARSAQVAENLQRDDVHPFEEAEAFRTMIDAGDATADQLAERFGKSRSYIYGRLKLLQACPSIRDACLAGAIGSEVALLIARLRTTDLQIKALAYIKGRYISLEDGGAESFRRIREELRERFTLAIKGAMFDPEDATLLPDAGVCSACPKRSGNAPEYADLLDEHSNRYGHSRRQGSPELCTDPDCWSGKTKAHLARKAGQLEEQGKTVIAGAKARQAISARGEIKDTYVPLAEVRDALKKVKGDTKPEVLTILDPRTGKTHQVVKTDDLRAGGVKTKAPKADGQGSRADSQWARQREREEQAVAEENTQRVALFKAVRARVAETARGLFDLQLLAAKLLDDVGHTPLLLLHEVWGMAEQGTLEDRLPTMTADELTQLAIDCVLCADLEVHWHGEIKNRPKPLMAAARHYGLDEAGAVQTSADGAATPASARQLARDARARKKARALAGVEAAEEAAA